MEWCRRIFFRRAAADLRVAYIVYTCTVCNKLLVASISRLSPLGTQYSASWGSTIYTQGKEWAAPAHYSPEFQAYNYTCTYGSTCTLYIYTLYGITSLRVQCEPRYTGILQYTLFFLDGEIPWSLPHMCMCMHLRCTDKFCFMVTWKFTTVKILTITQYGSTVYIGIAMGCPAL